MRREGLEKPAKTREVFGAVEDSSELVLNHKPRPCVVLGFEGPKSFSRQLLEVANRFLKSSSVLGKENG